MTLLLKCNPIFTDDMRFWWLLLLFVLELLLWVQTANAAPVINEVMWAGSDQSSSDEWFELALPTCTGQCLSQDLSNWTISYLKSTGQETVMLTIPSGVVIAPGQYLVISHFNAANSRLSVEPAVINASVTLLNTGLKLILKDQNGTVIDEVDDASGTPFAGSNPSSPGIKASMERIDPLLSGSIKENWRSATTSRGLDSGAAMLATPGFENGSSDTPTSSSSSSSQSSSNSSLQSSSSSLSISSASSSVSSDSSVSSESSLSSSSTSSCSSSFIPAILLQSGSFDGVGKVTLNVQAVASSGSMTGVTCHFDFGDGNTSESCNPGVHSYTQAGAFTLLLEAKNQCGNTLIQTRGVLVTALSSSSSSASNQNSSIAPFDGSQILISGILPNSDGTDRDKEWIELKNMEDKTVSLAGWHIAIGRKTIRRHVIDSVVSLYPHQTIRLYQSETGYSFSNAAETVELLDPSGTVQSSVHWEKAIEGVVYLSDSFKDQKLSGIVQSVIDPVSIRVSLDAMSEKLVGFDTLRVRLLGVQLIDEISTNKNRTLEFIRALIESKKVDLLFDSDVWNDSGEARAYMMLEDGRVVQNEMLRAGLLMADQSQEYRSRQEYSDLQNDAMKKQAGLWFGMKLSLNEKSIGAQQYNEKIAYISDTTSTETSVNSSPILITEIYASPLTSSKNQQESGSYLDHEWIELWNPSSEEISLVGWSLTIGKKTMTFGASSRIEAHQHVILLAQQIGLKLRNDGDYIVFSSPERNHSISLDYPKLKNGQSYVFEEGSKIYCVQKNPSPGEAGNCSMSEVSHSTVSETKKTTVSKKKTVTAAPKKTVYTKYAQSYDQDLRLNPSETISLPNQTDGQIPLIVLLLGGIVAGSTGSLLILSSKKVRDLLYVRIRAP